MALSCERARTQIDHLLQPENWAIIEAARIYYIASFFSTHSPKCGGPRVPSLRHPSTPALAPACAAALRTLRGSILRRAR